MASNQHGVRRRLDPAVRRNLILDCAADMIAAEGVASLSMDRIGREAGVSKSLVYNYFDNLKELLKALLERELRALRRAQLAAAESARTFEDLVKQVTHEYLKYIHERGLIIERLQAEPSITTLHDPTDYSRDAAVSYLANIIARQFSLPMNTARAATDISFGLPASAGEYLLRTGTDRKEVEDMTVKMIIGSLQAITNDRLTSQLSLDRRGMVLAADDQETDEK